MKKIILLCFLIILIFEGCQSQKVLSNNMEFIKVDNNWHVKNIENYDDYNYLKEQLDSLNIELSKDTKVASLTATTSNILYKLNMNIVASVNSTNLDNNLVKEIDNEEIANLGISTEPNLEILLKSEADVVFVSSEMPISKEVQNLDNLVILPQGSYENIFIIIQTLIQSFNLDETNYQILNNLIQTHNKAIELKDSSKKNLEDVAVLKYSYEEFSVVPNDTFISTFMEELDIPNIYSDYSSADFNLSKEVLLSDNPEYIIIYAKGESTKEQLEIYLKNQNLNNLSAYQKDQIYLVSGPSLSATLESPNLLLDLSEQIYG